MIPDYPYFLLASVLLVYRSHDEGLKREGRDLYVETRQVLKGADGRLRYGAATPLSVRAAQTLADELRQSASTSLGFLDGRLLAASTAGALVWWCPPARRELPATASVGLHAGERWWPGLVLSTRGEGLSVWAVRGDARPKSETRLYRAPLGNIFDNGAMCSGTARPREGGDAGQRMAAWERVLFTAPFTHEGGWPVKSKDGKAVWDRLVGTDERFPDKELVDARMTVGELVRRVAG